MSLHLHSPRVEAGVLHAGVDIPTAWGNVVVRLEIPRSGIDAGAGKSLTQGLVYGVEALSQSVQNSLVREPVRGPGQVCGLLSEEEEPMTIGDVLSQNYDALSACLVNPAAPCEVTLVVDSSPLVLGEEAFAVARGAEDPQASAVLDILRDLGRSLDPAKLELRAACLRAIDAAHALSVVAKNPAMIARVTQTSEGGDEQALTVRQALAAQKVAGWRAQGCALGCKVANGDAEALAHLRTTARLAGMGDVWASVVLGAAAIAAPTAKRTPKSVSVPPPPPATERPSDRAPSTDPGAASGEGSVEAFAEGEPVRASAPKSEDEIARAWDKAMATTSNLPGSAAENEAA